MAITNHPENYLHGLPDTLFYENPRRQLPIDAATGETMSMPAPFISPKSMSVKISQMYDEHIRKSQAGDLPREQCFGFIDSQGKIHYASEVDQPEATRENGESDGEGRSAEGENFTKNLDGMGDSEDDDESEVDLKPIPPKHHKLRSRKKTAPTLPDGIDTDMSGDEFNPAEDRGLPKEEEIRIPPRDVIQALNPRSGPIQDRDACVRRIASLIPWKGTASPVLGGPMVVGAVEAILLDEIYGFAKVRLTVSLFSSDCIIDICLL